MTNDPRLLFELLREDTRYSLEAYQFVRDGLAYAHHHLGMGGETASDDPTEEESRESHLTGQQLCEAIRLLALEQYGYMAKLVLNSWGVHRTDDFGEIVYNLIRIKLMKKSPQDKRTHFNGVYDFDEAFVQDFQFTVSE